MACPNCKDGVYVVLGENKFKVKVFLNTNCDTKKFEKEIKELARQYEEEEEK